MEHWNANWEGVRRERGWKKEKERGGEDEKKEGRERERMLRLGLWVIGDR